MAKGKYDKWLEPDGLLRLEAWARDGLTDEQISANMAIAVGTLYKYKNEYHEISKALKRGKEPVDIEVENALLKRALGYTATIQKTFKIKKVIVKNGERREVEELAVGYDEVHIPADTTAQIYWLKNRKPNEWRDRREITQETSITLTNEQHLTVEELKALAKNNPL